MRTKRQYEMMTVGVLFLFVYLLATEVVDRISSTLGLYAALCATRASLMTPEELKQKESELEFKRIMLLKMLNSGNKLSVLNQTGVVDFVNACADKAKLRFTSLTPTDTSRLGEIVETGFGAVFQGTFSQARAFVHELETGSLPTEIQKTDMETTRPGGKWLKVIVSGKVRFVQRDATPK